MKVIRGDVYALPVRTELQLILVIILVFNGIEIVHRSTNEPPLSNKESLHGILLSKNSEKLYIVNLEWIFQYFYIDPLTE